MNVNIEKGSLDGRVFPFLVKEIYTHMATGMLSLKRDHIRKFVFFSNGCILMVQSSLREEQLGQAMLRGGVYDDEVYGIVMDLVRQKGWKSSALSGYVSAQTARWWMKTLIREVFLSLMEWESGTYRFFHGKRPPSRAITVEIDAMRLLISSVRRIRYMDVLIQWIGDLDAVPVVHGDVLKKMGSVLNLTPTEGFFLSRIDGTLTCRQILAMSGSQKNEMLRFLVGSLFSGLITMVPKEPVGRPKRKSETPLETVEVRHAGAGEDTSPEELQPENTEDVELTADELSELNQLAKEVGVDLLDVESALEGRKKKPGDEDITGKIQYLRDGEFVGADEMGEALDIDELKKKSVSGSTRAWSKHQEKLGRDEDRLTVWIKGQEVDAESDFIGEEGVKMSSGDDEEEQWNRWMYVEVDESDAEYMTEWETGWRTWQDHYREMQELKKAQEQIDAEIKATKEAERLEELRQRFFKINREIERKIDEKKREIILAHRRAGIQNHYEILHLSPDATQEEIEKAFHYWYKEYQPQEEYISEFKALVDVFDELFDKLQQAYEVLRDPEKKRLYDENLKKQIQASKAIKEKKKRLAEDHLVSALQAKKRGDYMLAMRYLRGSISLDPKNAGYFREMAELLVENKAWWAEALKYYKRAFHLDPNNATLLLDVAGLAIKMGMKNFAENALKHALSIDGKSARAKKMLRDLRSQQL